MTNQNSILVPTDFSSPARKAMRYAVENYADTFNHLILLNAYAGMSPTAAPMISLQDLLRHRSEEGLRKEYEYLCRNFDCSRLDISRVSSPNSLQRAIQEVLQRQNVHLIVMGNSHHVTDHMAIARSAGRPLVLVPEDLSSL